MFRGAISCCKFYAEVCPRKLPGNVRPWVLPRCRDWRFALRPQELHFVRQSCRFVAGPLRMPQHELPSTTGGRRRAAISIVQIGLGGRRSLLASVPAEHCHGNGRVALLHGEICAAACLCSCWRCPGVSAGNAECSIVYCFNDRESERRRIAVVARVLGDLGKLHNGQHMQPGSWCKPDALLREGDVGDRVGSRSPSEGARLASRAYRCCPRPHRV
mmetsp:Transcript_53870/g.175214  ORF Transcript_53870/g.175214 Transcript_53870/m.175214 type:complete len:216 (-) Transcript_53870:413-1060(-)